MMFENELFQYGIAGIFIFYLIYDRQVILKRITKSIDQNTAATYALVQRLNSNKCKEV